ncbi:barstar family protein [Actinomadura meridiana]
MKLASGVSIIDTVDAEEVAQVANQAGCVLYQISMAGRSGRESFFAAIKDALPLDPPISGARSWEALADSLWEGIHQKNHRCAVILWSDATTMAEESPRDFAAAVDVLTDVARLLGDPDAAAGRPTDVCVYVAKRTNT